MEKTAEVKMLETKLSLTEDILANQDYIIWRVNTLAGTCYDTLMKDRKDDNDKIILTISKDELSDIYKFFYILREDDLVSSSYSDSINISKAKEIQIKQEILNKLK